jgi:hypothetical protein
MIRRVLLTLSLLVTPARALLIDIAPDQLDAALHEETHALVHVHNGTPAEEVTGAKVDVIVYSVPDAHPDFPRAKSDLYAVVRGVAAPYHGIKNEDTVAYLGGILPNLYVEAEEPPAPAPFQIVNGDPDHDARVLETCLHLPDVDCYHAPGEPLRANGTVYAGGDVDAWIRSALVPPLVREDDVRALTIALRMFEDHLFVFADGVDEHVLPVAETFRDSTATMLYPVGHQLADYFEVAGPGAVHVRQKGADMEKHVYVGDVTADTLRAFVAGI